MVKRWWASAAALAAFARSNLQHGRIQPCATAAFKTTYKSGVAVDVLLLRLHVRLKQEASTVSKHAGCCNAISVASNGFGGRGSGHDTFASSQRTRGQAAAWRTACVITSGQANVESDVTFILFACAVLNREEAGCRRFRRPALSSATQRSAPILRPTKHRPTPFADRKPTRRRFSKRIIKGP